MECPTCHFQNRSSARFCQQCGQSLADALPPPPAAAEGALPLPAPAASNPAQPAAAPAAAPTPDVAMTADQAAPEATLASPTPTATPQDGPFHAAETAPAAASEPPAPASAPPVTQEPAPAATTEPLAPEVPAPSVEPPTFAVGDTLADRYVVLEVQEHAGQAQYVVRDRQLCHVCQQPLANPDDAFCDNCGAVLAEQKLVLDGTAVHEGQVSQEVPPLASLTPAAPPVAAAPRFLRLTAAARSHPGQQRELNEDSLSLLTFSQVFETRLQGCGGLYVVADGMGGHDGGEVASRLAVQAINAVLTPALPSLVAAASPAEEISALLIRAVLAANQTILDAGQARGSDMGSTVTLALVIGDTAYVANVGDSRTYHWSGNLLRRVTDDHSLVWSLFRAGQITEDEIYSHDMRNYIYRNLGAKPALDVDTFVQPLAPGDRLLLCSDGLWEMVRSDGFEMVLNATPDPQAACDRLIDDANQAGGEDNITVILVQVGEGERP